MAKRKRREKTIQSVKLAAAGPISAPTPQSGPTPEENKPVFCLRFQDRKSKYCISRCDKKFRAQLLKRFDELSQLTWQEIIQSSHRHIGFEELPRAKIRIHPTPIVTPEITNYLVGRFAGGKYSL